MSREIVFGIGFATLGFLFFIMQALKLGSPMLRRIIALATAVVGIALVIAQSQIYYSLPTVPAWNSWATWVQFFGTTLLLGSLAVGTAFVLVIARRRQRVATMSADELAAAEAVDVESMPLGARMRSFLKDERIADADTRGQVQELLTQSVRAVLGLAVVVAGVLLIAMPLYVAQLAGMGGDGLTSAAHYATLFAGLRFTLLVLGAFMLGLLAFYYAGFGLEKLGGLGYLMLGSLVLVVIGEFMGRALFYEVMTRVGV